MPRKRRGRGEGSVIQRGPNLWEGRISLGFDANGRRQRRTVYGKSKQEVLRRLAEIRLQARNPSATNLTVEQWLNHWLQQIQLTHSPSTVTRYRSGLKTLIPLLGKTPLHRLHGWQVLQQLSTFSSASRASLWTILHNAIRQAVRQQVLVHDPLAEIKKPHHVQRTFAVFSEEQVRYFLQTAQQQDIFYYLLFLLALTSGLRLNELRALTWRNWDPATKTITVEFSLGGDDTLRPPKSKSSRRCLRLPSETVRVLELYRQYLQQQGRPTNDEAFIFSLRCGKIVSIKQIYRYLTKIIVLTNARLAEQNISPLPFLRFHDLRHTHATQLLRRGMSIKAVAARMGHASATITLHTYAHVLHLDDQQLCEALEKDWDLT
jgi:integrase